jgi:hypothetical protein
LQYALLAAPGPQGEQDMATPDLFQRLRKALSDLKTVLDTNSPVLKPAIQTLKLVLPQAGNLLGQLIGLLNDLKAEIQNLDVSNVTGLAQLSTFAASAEAVLRTSEDLLLDDKDNISDVLRILDVVEALPSLNATRADILALIDGIVADLNSLNS